MRSLTLLALLYPLAVLAHAGTVPVKKVLVIGVDGLRPDALAAATTPNVDGLIATGAFSDDGQAEDFTFSGPNWSSILHGVHRDKHLVTSNDYTGDNLAAHPDFLAWLESHDLTLETVRLSTWDAIFNFQPTGADIDLFADYAQNGDEKMLAEAQRLLLGIHGQYPGFDVDAMFFYFADPDVAGHEFGFDPDVSQYLAEIEQVDGQIGQLLSSIAGRPTFANEDWLVVMTSDHGGSITGSHSGNTPEKRRVPFLVSGPSAAVGPIFPSPKNCDVSKTVLAHMGAAIPASLDGHVVGLQSTAPPVAVFGTNLLFNGGAEFDRGFADFLPDQYCSGWVDPGPDQITIIEWDTPGGWPVSTDPGPPNRGLNFFSGNAPAGCRMAQVIDVSPLASSIDVSGARYELSAWLGGYSTQEDRAQVTATFLDANGVLLGVDTIGPVTAADRGGQTGLLLRESKQFGVPAGTRTIDVSMRTFYGAGGGTDGYADEIALVLVSGNAPPPPRPLIGRPTAGTTEWRFSGDTGATIPAVDGPGVLEYADGDGGVTDQVDTFVTSDGILVPHIDGTQVDCLRFVARTATTQGYSVRSGVETAANLGHTRFSLVFDILVASGNSNPWLALWNASPTHANDSELFLRPDVEALWTTSAETVDADWRKGEWNRIVFVQADDLGSAEVYVNGAPAPAVLTGIGDHPADGTPDPFRLLGDDTNSETGDGWLAAFAFVDDALTEAEVATLGGPRAGGIFPACGFLFGIDPPVASPSTEVFFTTCGGVSGQPGQLFVTSVNGVPVINPLPLPLFGTFDAMMLWSVAISIPPGLAPIDVGLTSYALTPGGAVVGAPEKVLRLIP